MIPGRANYNLTRGLPPSVPPHVRSALGALELWERADVHQLMVLVIRGLDQCGLRRAIDSVFNAASDVNDHKFTPARAELIEHAERWLKSFRNQL